MRSRLRSAAAWLGLVAALLASLAPALSHAVAAARGADAWGAVCTTTPVDRRDGAPASPAAHAGDTCPWCLQQAWGAALPPAAPAFVPAAGGGGEPPATVTAAAVPPAWHPAAARAPPPRA